MGAACPSMFSFSVSLTRGRVRVNAHTHMPTYSHPAVMAGWGAVQGSWSGEQCQVLLGIGDGWGYKYHWVTENDSAVRASPHG